MESTKVLALPDEQQFRNDIQAINQFQKVVRANMVDGQDYGVIPGTQKPTLLKPGAEKIAKLLGLADLYEIVDKVENWQTGLFRYLIKCSLSSVATEAIISEGLGECNSMESKYRWRWVFPDDVPDDIDKAKLAKKTGRRRDGKGTYIQYRLENDDIYSQVNTILKMAKKRALVDAALSAGRLSQVFTQDIEDMSIIHDEPKATIKDKATEPIEEKIPPSTDQEPMGGEQPNTIEHQRDELFQFVADKMKAKGISRAVLVNRFAVPDKLLDTDIQAVWEHLKTHKPEWFENSLTKE